VIEMDSGSCCLAQDYRTGSGPSTAPELRLVKTLKARTDKQIPRRIDSWCCTRRRGSTTDRVILPDKHRKQGDLSFSDEKSRCSPAAIRTVSRRTVCAVKATTHFPKVMAPGSMTNTKSSWPIERSPAFKKQRSAGRLRRVFVPGFELSEKSRSLLCGACSAHEAAALE
jgi:hypothetical protein